MSFHIHFITNFISEVEVFSFSDISCKSFTQLHRQDVLLEFVITRSNSLFTHCIERSSS